MKSIDSDTQMLVYENYNKFIKATDTIRGMKDNIDEINKETMTIVTNVDCIQTITEKIKKSLQGTVEKTEHLVKLRKLLQKLEYIFDLPIRLSRAIELGLYEQAVKNYNSGMVVLRQQESLIPAFKGVANESKDIIEKLRVRLKELTSNTDDTITGTKLGEYYSLLMLLNEPRETLRSDFVEKYKNRMGNRLSAFSSTVIEGEDIVSFVHRLDENILEYSVDQCRVYASLFMKCENTQDNTQAKNVLTEVNKSFFVAYINILKTKYKSETIGSDIDKLSASLKHVVASAKNARSIVCYPRLSDKASEIVEGVVRQQVDVLFNALRDKVGSRLVHIQEHIDNKTGGEGETPSWLHEIGNEVSIMIAGDIEASLKDVKRVCNITVTLLQDMVKVFNALVKGHVHDFFLWTNRYYSSSNNYIYICLLTYPCIVLLRFSLTLMIVLSMKE